jgi:serine/threonine-protein kinase
MKVCPACGLVYPDETTFCFVTGDTLKALPDQVTGTTIAGRFRIVDKLAEGPWATIYRAGYRLLERKCAVKVFNEPLGDEQRVQLVQAILLARRCTHPNIAELVGGGVLGDGRGFVVHSQLEGQSLAEVLSRGPLPPARALGVAVQILKALGRIHDFGGVHGSLRPSNVLVTREGHAEVYEIGLGRSFLRDPWDDDPPSLSAQQYLAPELSSQRRASSKADLYAVGVIAAHMLSGRPPFDARSVSELRSKLNDQGVDIEGRLGGLHESLREWLKQVVGRGTEGRPPNAHLALEDLLAACAQAGIKPDADPGPAPQAPLEPIRGFARWEKFRAVFAKMVEMGFPAGAPDQTKNALAAIASRVEHLAGLGKKAAYEHGSLQDVLGRAREGRERVAAQMDEINDSAMEVRRELHPLLVAASRHGEKATLFPAQVMEQHREVLRWEGRSAFAEPYRELAEAHRVMAELIERWWGVRNAQLTCEKEAAEKREELRVFEEQLDELRAALRVHESNLAAEIEACELALAALGEEADNLETDLLSQSSRFCAPLRAKPELGVLFHELSKVS